MIDINGDGTHMTQEVWYEVEVSLTGCDKWGPLPGTHNTPDLAREMAATYDHSGHEFRVVLKRLTSEVVA